jgi:ribose transport system ATP-binding protein
MAREAGEQLARFGIDVDPMAPAGRPPDRAAAADRDRARAVLRRPHHHPGRADLRPLAARGRAPVRDAARGCASEGTRIVFISHFIEDILASPTP